MKSLALHYEVTIVIFGIMFFPCSQLMPYSETFSKLLKIKVFVISKLRAYNLLISNTHYKYEMMTDL